MIENSADPTESKITCALWTGFQKWQTKNYRIQKIKASKERQYPTEDIYLLSNDFATRYNSRLPFCHYNL